ncbi:hypothetical protein [Curtobacterium sp. MCPF17_046]|uniref:hypothetical protein n=1 Tax=Curtobacterium sp. MCPF17_046 TaxID=2175663 RepID=UPI000D829253|nr:hypothetical protein [Curtobacterium sp. MCPF17_046]PYY39311.1 hypothetical protein DEJ32_08260 [Curtobacterium sp. MCPF17_046]
MARLRTGAAAVAAAALIAAVGLLLRLPVALPVSASLVAASVAVMTTPPASDRWVTGLAASAAMFLAITYTGAAINERRRR